MLAKLAESLVREFVKITNDTTQKKLESFLYGTVDHLEGSGDEITVFVLFDGGSDLTPCRTSVNVAVGDRVLAMFKNRQVIITANISNPTINASYLEAGEGVFTGSVKVLGSDDGGLTQEVDISPGYGPAILVTGNISSYNTEYTCKISPTQITMDEDDNDRMQSMSISPDSLRFDSNSDDGKTSANRWGFRAQVGTGAQLQYSELQYNGVRTSSDARLKRDIEPISPNLALNLRPVKFRFKKDDSIHYGFIAQDVQSVLPDTVGADNNGYLSLNYSELIAPILSLVQNLERRVKELESERN